MAVNHKEIAERLGLARSTVTKILNQLPQNRASADTIKRVFQTAREMGYDFSRLRNIHRRRADRRAVDLPVRMRILLDNGSLYDTGRARVCNLSPYGALLADIVTHKRSLPLAPFTLGLTFLAEPLVDVSLEAQVIRLLCKRHLEIGVNFLRIKASAEKRIIDFLGK